MRKFLLVLILLAGIASGATYNNMMKKQCQYNLSIIDEYNTIANGYLMGIVVGIQAVIPANERSKIVNQKLGYITDKACILALNNKSKLGFERKFKEAAYKIMKK
jgi:hypothetical protein